MASEEQAGSQNATGRERAEIEELEQHVEHVVSSFLFDPDDHKTVSVVVRDEDGEVIGECFPQIRSGVYALTRVVDEPADRDEYRVDREDPPGWVEWVFDDPPMDHFVTGLRCTACGESDEHVLRQTPNVIGEFHWKRLRHKGTCEHASEKDEETWPDRKRAREIRSRPHPRTMAVGCIWRESDDLQDLLGEGEWSHEAAEDRLGTIGFVLEDRLDVEYPTCPDCGQELRHRERGWADCSLACGETDARREFWRRYFRVWGRRGHLGHGPSDGGEGRGE